MTVIVIRRLLEDLTARAKLQDAVGYLPAHEGCGAAIAAPPVGPPAATRQCSPVPPQGEEYLPVHAAPCSPTFQGMTVL